MKKRLADRIHRMTPSATVELAGKIAQLRSQGVDILSFSVGEPDFETPDNICQAAKQAIDDGFTKYTAAAGLEPVRREICKKLEKDNGLAYTPDQIIICTGAKQALYNAFMAICNPGDEVILPTPCWVSYMEIIKMAGGVPVPVPCGEDNGFQPRIEDLRAAVTDRTAAILFCSPNNPTGAVYSRELLTEIGQLAAEHGLFVVSDEIYEALVYDEARHYSVAALCPGIKDSCIVINGVSKTYAMTGWRVGYAAGPRDIIKAMCSLQGHMTSNTVAINQMACMEAMQGPQDAVVRMHDEYARRRRYMMDRLNAMSGVRCPDAKGAFYVFPNVGALYGKSDGKRTIRDSSDLAAYLLEEAHVAVVPGVAFQAPEYLRLTYASSMENIIEGMDRMEAALQKLK